jgi:hypothetical protein
MWWLYSQLLDVFLLRAGAADGHAQLCQQALNWPGVKLLVSTVCFGNLLAAAVKSCSSLKAVPAAVIPFVKGFVRPLFQTLLLNLLRS